MAYDIRYPMITGASEKEQLIQMKSYLHQLVEQLNYSLNNIDKVQVQYVRTPSAESSKKEEDKGTQATFNDLKPLIIKSAEIVNSYYETINERLEGIYVAQSDFGTFAEQTSQDIQATSKDVTQAFTNIQAIETEINYTQQDIVNINSNIETIDSNVVALGGSVNELDDELKTVEENVGAIDSELKTVEENVNGLDNNLKTVEGNVGQLETNLQDTKSGIGSNLESLSAEVGQIDTDLQGVKAGVDTNVKALTDEVGEIDSKLEDAKSAINSDIEALKNELDNIVYSIIEVNAHIKSGLLYYDENEVPIYGLEIGQINTIDGVEVFNKYARFTAGRLSFYDKNDIEVAYISDYKLYITNAEITGTLKLGAFLIDTSKGFRLKYVGRR